MFSRCEFFHVFSLPAGSTGSVIRSRLFSDAKKLIDIGFEFLLNKG